MTTSDLAVSTGIVLADARRHQVPDPLEVRVGRDPRVLIQLESLADLAQWAQWAEAVIAAGEPHQHVGQFWAITHTAEGSIAELPVLLAAVELGVMTEKDVYDCDRCGARLETSGGFVAVGTYDDQFEREITGHADGACVPAGVLS